MAQLLDNTGIIRKGGNSVNTVPRIRPGLVRRKTLGKNSIVQVLVFFMLVGQEAERPRDRRAVTRQTEDDWRLLSAVEGNKEMPPRVVDNLSKFRRSARARSNNKWR